MKLSVATNFDPVFLNSIRKYPVYEVYGSLSDSILGGVLPAPFLPHVDKNTIERTIHQAHQLGIQFNYVLNTSCSGNLENSRKGMRKIYNLLEWLSDVKVDIVTVSLPYLIDYMKKNFPDLKIKVSIADYIDTLQRAQFYKRMGVDAITIDSNQNRNFELLRLLKKELNLEISLLVNNLCLWGCPYALYHANSSSHSSENKTYFNNYCDFNCRLIKTESPVEMIKSRWIRPEDLSFYEAIGLDNFKIGGRTKSTDFLISTVAAYSNRSYDGNFIDILNTYQEIKDKPNIKLLNTNLEINEKTLKKIPDTLLKVIFHGYGLMPNLPKKKIVKMISKLPSSLIKEVIDIFINSSVPYINNKELNGFLEIFDKIDCSKRDCIKCGHCQAYADKAISFTEEERSRYASKLRKILDLMNKIK